MDEHVCFFENKALTGFLRDMKLYYMLHVHCPCKVNVMIRISLSCTFNCSDILKLSEHVNNILIK